MTLDPAATPGTTEAPPVVGSVATVTPGTTEQPDPAGGSVGADQLEALRVQLDEERRKNAQLLSEKSTTEQMRRDAENRNRGNARIEADFALLDNPGDATVEQIADARWRISMAAVAEATARAEAAERRAQQVEERLTTPVPDKHRDAISARAKTTGKSYAEAANEYELEQRRAGTWDDPPKDPPKPGPPAASPAGRPVGTVLRGVPPSTQPLPRQLTESQYHDLRQTNPAQFEQLRKARVAGTFVLTPDG